MNDGRPSTRDHIIRTVAGFVSRMLECERKEAVLWLARLNPDERQMVLRMFRTRNMMRASKRHASRAA
jgi:hypothetical protein